MAEQFTTTNGPSARLEPWWISRATVSLPAPEGPVISTRLPVGATRSSWLRTLAAAPDEPTNVTSPPARRRRLTFSRRSRSASMARSTTSSRRSALKGFSMKS